MSGLARARAPRRRRSRGIALADFITGTLILAGAVTTWAALTRAQFDSAGFSDRRVTARNAALEALDRAKLGGAAALAATGEADKEGFRFVRAFPVAGLRPAKDGDTVGRVETRPAIAEGQPAGSVAAIEVRAVVHWRGEKGSPERYEISTVLAGGGP